MGLLPQRADLAVAGLTISKPREEDVDFTTPYMDLGLSFVLKKRMLTPHLFEFLKPFSRSVWSVLLGTILLVGFSICILEMLSPNGCHGEFVHTHHNMDRISRWRRLRKSHRRDSKKAFGFMSFANAVFFAIATLLQQGFEAGYPMAPSSRMVVLFWWLAVIVIGAMYTAQLGALVISERLQGEIKSLEDLYVQSKVQYGTSANSAIIQLFCDSPIDMYRDMCKNMIKNKNLLGANTDYVERVENGSFAYITDSIILEDVVSHNCNLKMIGELFNKFGHGIGLQKGSPYTHALSMAVLELRENGYLADLQRKWFTGKCPRPSENEAVIGQMGASYLRGVFFVLAFALLACPFLIVIECIMSCVKHRNQEVLAENKPTMRETTKQIFSKFRRDFLYYSLPEVAKYKLGLDRYTQVVREADWQTQAALYREQAEKQKEELLADVNGTSEQEHIKFKSVVQVADLFAGGMRRRSKAQVTETNGLDQV